VAWDDIDDPIVSSCTKRSDYAKHMDPIVRKDLHRSYTKSFAHEPTVCYSVFCCILAWLMKELNISMRKNKGVSGDCPGQRCMFRR
jgi:hypothetical protein